MGAFLGPIMAGAIGGHYGWQSFFWLETALSGVSIVLIALTFPETKYHRGSSAIAAKEVRTSNDGPIGENGEQLGNYTSLSKASWTNLSSQIVRLRVEEVPGAMHDNAQPSSRKVPVTIKGLGIERVVGVQPDEPLSEAFAVFAKHTPTPLEDLYFDYTYAAQLFEGFTWTRTIR